jgi:hypothetical protein
MCPSSGRHLTGSSMRIVTVAGSWAVLAVAKPRDFRRAIAVNKAREAGQVVRVAETMMPATDTA